MSRAREFDEEMAVQRAMRLFWRKGYAGFEQPHPVETVDIAPEDADRLYTQVGNLLFDESRLRTLDVKRWAVTGLDKRLEV